MICQDIQSLECDSAIKEIPLHTSNSSFIHHPIFLRKFSHTITVSMHDLFGVMTGFFYIRFYDYTRGTTSNPKLRFPNHMRHISEELGFLNFSWEQDLWLGILHMGLDCLVGCFLHACFYGSLYFWSEWFPCDS